MNEQVSKDTTHNQVPAQCTLSNLELPFARSIALLRNPLCLDHYTLNNRIVNQPMEGYDSLPDGSPGPLTFRRYRRFAQGGAGLIWMEATSIGENYRSNAHQLYLHAENVDSFKRLVEETRTAALNACGRDPILVLQSTHSGRYSRPNNKPQPIIAHHNPLLEGAHPLPDECIISDAQLRMLEEKYSDFVRLVKQAGFDGADIKCSHGYIASELLSAYDRPGPYGGSFENRTRFIVNCIRSAKTQETPSFFITSRLNAFDGVPYPYGFCPGQGDGLTPDVVESSRLLDILHHQLGMKLINITGGNPYFNPHVNRPYQNSVENPLAGVRRMIYVTKALQEQFPDLVIIGSGLSYLRELAPHVAAGAIEEGCFKLAGFGRLTLAYPSFPQALLEEKELDRNQCCLTCGSCSTMMSNCVNAGCLIHDGEIYRDIYASIS